MLPSDLQKIYQEVANESGKAKELKKLRIDDLGAEDFVLPERLFDLRNKVVTKTVSKYPELLPDEAGHLFNVALVKRVCDEFNGHTSSTLEYREAQIGKFKKLFGENNLKLLIAHGVLNRDLVDRTKYTTLLGNVPDVDLDFTKFEFPQRNQNERRELSDFDPVASFNITEVPNPLAVFRKSDDMVLVVGTGELMSGGSTRGIFSRSKSVTNGTEYDPYSDLDYVPIWRSTTFSISSQTIKMDEASNEVLLAQMLRVHGLSVGNEKIVLGFGKYAMNGLPISSGSISESKDSSVRDISSIFSTEVTDSGCFIHSQLNNGSYSVRQFDRDLSVIGSPMAFTTQPNRATNPELFGPEVDTTRITLEDGKTVQISGNSLEIFNPEPTLSPTFQPTSRVPTFQPTLRSPTSQPTLRSPTFPPTNNSTLSSRVNPSNNFFSDTVIGVIVGITLLLAVIGAIRKFGNSKVGVVDDNVEEDLESANSSVNEEAEREDSEARKAAQEHQRNIDIVEKAAKELEEKRRQEEVRKAAEARRKRQEEARKSAEESRRKEEEERKRKAAEERKKQEEEEKKRKDAEERRKRQEEARKVAEESRRKEEEERKRKAAEERKRQEDARKRREEEERKRAQTAPPASRRPSANPSQPSGKDILHKIKK